LLKKIKVDSFEQPLVVIFLSLGKELGFTFGEINQSYKVRMKIQQTRGRRILMSSPKRGELYKHFKGTIYQITGRAICSETEKELVLYKKNKERGDVWSRPLEMFTDIHPVHNVKRFERIETTHDRQDGGY